MKPETKPEEQIEKEETQIEPQIEPTEETTEEQNPIQEGNVPTEEAESEEQPEGPEQPKEDEKPSRRESLRIQKLIDKIKNAPEPSKLPEISGLDYSKELEADEEVVKKLDEDRKSYGEQAFNRGIEQAKSIQFHTRLEIDAPKVISKYPQLDPQNKEKFDPALADSVNSWYLNTVGYDSKTDTVQNSGIRYEEFADSIFELADRIANKKVETSVKNVVKQAATTGLRPDGSSTKKLNLDQPLSQMSDEELEAYGKKIGLATAKR